MTATDRALEFVTIAVSDGISMGHEGMRASLRKVLDYLRGFIIVLVVLHHSVLAYCRFSHFDRVAPSRAQASERREDPPARDRRSAWIVQHREDRL